MKRRDLLAAVVAVEPGCRGRDPVGAFAVEDRGELRVGSPWTARGAMRGQMPA